jgi:UDP-GlcNAc:undecaprenyl-phosphate GlcNAc-1-phosphate transferase
VRVLAAFAAGLVVGLVVLAASRRLLASPVLRRRNHRGDEIPTAGGLVAVMAVLVVAAAWSLLEALADERVIDGSAESRRLALLAFAGFALLGLVDDVLGSGDDGRGFKGHLGAIAHGRLTTGGMKLVGGLALAAVVCAPRRPDGFRQLVVDTLLVALAANLGNLLDRAPGRTLKAGLLFWVVLVVASQVDTDLLGVSAAVGAVAALLVADLREQLMLGDTGANALGAVLGLGVVLTASLERRTVVLVVVALLNLASEAVSFSRVIDKVAPLRWIDRVGRRAS